MFKEIDRAVTPSGSRRTHTESPGADMRRGVACVCSYHEKQPLTAKNAVNPGCRGTAPAPSFSQQLHGFVVGNFELCVVQIAQFIHGLVIFGPLGGHVGVMPTLCTSLPLAVKYWATVSCMPAPRLPTGSTYCTTPLP